MLNNRCCYRSIREIFVLLNVELQVFHGHHSYKSSAVIVGAQT